MKSTTTSNPFQRTRRTTLALAVLLALTMATAPASAHDAGLTNEHGELSAVPDPQRCAVQFQATDVGAGGVMLEVFSDAGEEPGLITRMNANGVPTSPPAPERDFAYNVTIWLTGDEALRADRILMTFFESEGDETVRHTAEVHFTPFACAVEPGATAPDCPPDVEVEATETSGVPLNVVRSGTVEDATALRVYRDDGSGFEPVDEQHPRFGVQYVDGQSAFFDVEPGETYRYQVTAINAAGESEGCEVVEATAVPFFGLPMLAALAMVGSVGAYRALRRRS